MTNQNAYRLGSMPRRVYQARLKPNWPAEEPCRGVLDLLEEWLGLLDKVKGRPLISEVAELQAVVEAEVDEHLERGDYERWQRRYEFLKMMGEQVEPPSPPEQVPQSSNSFELAGNLIDRTEDGDISSSLPPAIRPGYELGQLVSQCRFASPESTLTLRIAELVRGLTSEEWLTGRLNSAQGESIHECVVSRINLLDELLSTRRWPPPGEEAQGPSATRIGQAVAQCRGSIHNRP